MSEKLSDVVTIISGGTPKTSVKEFWDGDIDWLAVADFNSSNRYVNSASKKITELGLNNSNTKMLEKGDLIISARGTVGAIAQLTKPMAFNQSCFGLRGKKDKLDTDYLYYWLKNYVDVLLNKSQGSVFNTINLSTFDDIKIELPSIADQRKISNLLTLLDDKIQTNNQINQELEAMSKTLYDYWFVQFDFPDQNGKPYKSSGGKMVYNPELKREIPEGWGVEKLGDISQYVSEKVDSFELNIENYVGTDNMIADMGGIELTISIPKSGTSTKFSAGDILISNIRPYFKKIWLSDRTGGCSADVLCIRTNRTIPKEFIYATLARDDFFNYDVAGSKGSKMPRGDKKHIMEYPIVFEFGIAEQYSKIVKPIYEGVHENNNQNQELTQLRDWLLPMLMNGQVQVE